MASLEVPAVSTPSVSPKTSTLPFRPRIIPQENSLGPVGHNRRASQEDIKSPAVDSAISLNSTSFGDFEIPRTISQDLFAKHEDKQPACDHSKSHKLDEAHGKHAFALIAVDELDLPHPDGKLPAHHHGQHHAHLGAVPFKTIYAGPSGNQKCFEVPLNLLETKSKYFQKLFEQEPDMDHMVFDGADPSAMGLCVRWLLLGKLDKADSFHSLTHSFALYVLSIRFDMEELRNHAMDVIRHYYHDEDQTASPFRLEYIYNYTAPNDQMRRFIIATAAMRCCTNGILSNAMVLVCQKSNSLSFDLAQATINYHRGMVDVRAQPDCFWHLHKHTQECCDGEVAFEVDGA